MVRVIVEPGVLATLEQLTDVAEICGSDGRVVGYFAPTGQAHASTVDSAEVDWKEIERRKQAKRKGFTTKQVFEHLLSLTTDESMRGYLQKKIEILTERDACAGP
jgi:hypothetical protein